MQHAPPPLCPHIIFLMILITSLQRPSLPIQWHHVMHPLLTHQQSSLLHLCLKRHLKLPVPLQSLLSLLHPSMTCHAIVSWCPGYRCFIHQHSSIRRVLHWSGHIRPLQVHRGVHTTY
uniref:Secreted protein n=1 Tax=Arundo donax TaxID=35708 RepID=A0A0A8YQK3_ARUDO